MSSVWSLLSCDKSQPPVPRDVGSVDDALTLAINHLKASRFAHKERIDLAALKAHTGEAYAQVETVPDIFGTSAAL